MSNTYDPQDPSARPLTTAQLARLSQHPATDQAWTELNYDGHRVLWVALKDGWNYEGRTCVLGTTFKELLYNLGNAERGEAYAA